MGDEDGVQTAGPVDLAKIGQLVVLQAPAAAGRDPDAGIDQNAAPAQGQERTAGADFVSAAEKGYLDHTHSHREFFLYLFARRLQRAAL
jgi:hypothetical protein